MTYKVGSVYVAPQHGDHAGSVTFVCLYGHRILILDPGNTSYKTAAINVIVWKSEEWVRRGWDVIPPTEEG